eukprot:CAMPEP_0114149060 /NCGR_PEP_ID=MMETSP0043_2-20121206/21955_1 /TAXON_ID=464988 /ORGANISM="Hemiselmis andersenii, Strain CCMP644" /LENGTH=126 /DNA_ID=CAMNT_0001243673 /DNA_START=309 /DNA_END=689 /DNA_ORIENTATION=-
MGSSNISILRTRLSIHALEAGSGVATAASTSRAARLSSFSSEDLRGSSDATSTRSPCHSLLSPLADDEAPEARRLRRRREEDGRAPGERATMGEACEEVRGRSWGCCEGEGWTQEGGLNGWAGVGV